MSTVLPNWSTAGDVEVQRDRKTILPGDYAVSWTPAELNTLLGSCVAACLWDKKRQIGGMNHFMLPDTPKADLCNLSESTRSLRYGLYAMERLVNDLLMMGAKRANLVAKVFGGADITGALTHDNVGHRNGEFVLRFLKTDGIDVVAADLGGDHSRRIKMMTDTGKVRVYRLPRADLAAIEQENSYRKSLSVKPVEGKLVYF